MENPCNGRGVCVDGVNNFVCECDSGFTGNECQGNIDDCTGVNCSGHGQCVDGVNSYYCTCDPGYTGEKCEVNINECETMNVTCSGRGLCLDDINSYSCVCDSGLTGMSCNESKLCCKCFSHPRYLEYSKLFSLQVLAVEINLSCS